MVIHEAAHLLHYFKPDNFGLRVKRGQERFLDVRFDCRELFAYACEAYSSVLKAGDRKRQIEFAERMRRDAASFPKKGRESIAELVGAAARGGWKALRQGVVEQRPSRAQVLPTRGAQ